MQSDKHLVAFQRLAIAVSKQCAEKRVQDSQCAAAPVFWRVCPRAVDDGVRVTLQVWPKLASFCYARVQVPSHGLELLNKQMQRPTTTAPSIGCPCKA